MFAPRPERVAAELLRVCRLKTFARFIAPPGMPAPVLWGDGQVVRDRFGTGVSDLPLTRVIYRFDYPFGPAGVVEFFREYYGPTTRAFATLGDADRQALRADLVELWGLAQSGRGDQSDDRRCRVPRSGGHSRVRRVVAARSHGRSPPRMDAHREASML